MKNLSTQNKALLAAALIGLLVLVLSRGGVLLTGCSSTQELSANQQKETEMYKEAEVVRVVDGDTLQVKVEGEKKKVRLIGVNTPESVAGDERDCKEGEIASDYTKSLVKQGQKIWMTRDISYEDDYGRLLRYIWLQKPEEKVTDEVVAEKMLNAVLVKEGYAQAKSYPPDTLYDDLFKKLGKEALVHERGVSYKWA